MATMDYMSLSVENYTTDERGDGILHRAVEVRVQQNYPGKSSVKAHATHKATEEGWRPDVSLAMAEAICLCALRSKGVKV